MSILNQKQTKSNPYLNFNHKGGTLSTDCGLILVSDFIKKHKITSHIEKVRFNDSRLYHKYSNSDITMQVLYQLIAGYDSDSSANRLAHDPFCALLHNQDFASQPSLSRFWDRFDTDTIHDFSDIIQTLFDKVISHTKTETLIFDIDSTHIDTFGNQDETDYNAHYQTNGYHPLVLFESVSKMLVKSELRKGSSYTSNGVVDFIAPILKQYGNSHTCLLRGDSGFALPELFEECESTNVNYTIRLKRNNILSKKAENYSYELRDGGILEEDYYYFIKYQANSWDKERIVAVHSRKPEGQLLFIHEFIVTNFSCFEAEEIFRIYRNRGVMENSIKELKSGFFYEKSDSSKFIENTGRTLIAGLAYNIIGMMKQLYFDEDSKKMTINTIRLRLFKVAGKVIHHARNIRIQLSSSHVYQELFKRVSNAIRSTQLNC